MQQLPSMIALSTNKSALYKSDCSLPFYIKGDITRRHVEVSLFICDGDEQWHRNQVSRPSSYKTKLKIFKEQPPETNSQTNKGLYGYFS
jgi:hypothetical protein